MYDVKPLLLTILDSSEHGPVLVLADWLEERGDEFAAELRRPKIGPDIAAIFRNWCNDHGFTPTLELLKDAAKMRTKHITWGYPNATMPRQPEIDGESLRRVMEEIRRVRRSRDISVIPPVGEPYPTPSGGLVRPLWEWRGDRTQWLVNQTTTDNAR